MEENFHASFESPAESSAAAIFSWHQQLADLWQKLVTMNDAALMNGRLPKSASVKDVHRRQVHSERPVSFILARHSRKVISSVGSDDAKVGISTCRTSVYGAKSWPGESTPKFHQTVCPLGGAAFI